MADEIEITMKATVRNGSYVDSIPNETIQIDQAAIGAFNPVVSVGTSEEDLAVADITTLGVLYLKNLDATNYVTWGPKSGGSMVALGRIKPGEIAWIRLEPAITIRWIANTAAVKVQVKLYEN